MSDFTQAPEFARARALFEEEFGAPAADARQLAVYAPGRSEIAGNHTDHEGGHVIAGAVNVAVFAPSPTAPTRSAWPTRASPRLRSR